MHVEWQGDHRLLGDDVKQDFERELTHLGLDSSKFLVEVRREPDLPGADGLDAMRYDIYITDLEHARIDFLAWVRRLTLLLIVSVRDAENDHSVVSQI